MNTPYPPPPSAQGDSVAGDKVMGNKIIYMMEGKRITLPSRRELLEHASAILKEENFARWADLPESSDEVLYEKGNEIAPDTYVETHARPLSTRVASFRPQTQEQESPQQEVIETLLDSPRSVLLGEPGSGKSRALQRLTWVLAEQTLAGELANDDTDNPSPILLPIFASLADYQGESDLVPLLRRALNGLGALVIEDDHSLRQLLRAKNVRTVLLLDGLNELDAHHSKAGYLALRNHLADYPHNTLHLSCRTADYDLATQTLPKAAIWVVQPLCDDIRYWGDSQGESDLRSYLRRHLGENAGKRLYDRLKADERLRSLARLPLFLWMFKELAGTSAGDLPADRGSLVQGFVERMILKLEKQLQPFVEESLCQLAWRLQESGRLECNPDELETILQQLPGMRRPSEPEIRQALQECGLLIDLGRNRLKLLHQLVQEYAAAAHLTRMAECSQRLPKLAEAEAWRESVILALWLNKTLHTPDYLFSLMTKPAVDMRVRVEAARILAQIAEPRISNYQT